MTSGIPVDLPDGRSLLLGALKPESALAGRSVGACLPLDGQEDLEIIAVLRQGHMLLPHAELLLRPGDRIMVIASPAGCEAIAQELAVVQAGQS